MEIQSGYTNVFRKTYKSCFSRKERTSTFLLKHTGTCLTGWDKGAPVLCAHVMENDSMIYILYLGVLPEHRHKGHGKSLLAYLTASHKPVACGIQSAEARNFYLACGLHPTGWIHADADDETEILCSGHFDPEAYHTLWNSLFGMPYPMELKRTQK